MFRVLQGMEIFKNMAYNKYLVNVTHHIIIYSPMHLHRINISGTRELTTGKNDDFEFEDLV